MKFKKAKFKKLIRDCVFCERKKEEKHQVCANCEILLHEKDKKDYMFRLRKRLDTDLENIFKEIENKEELKEAIKNIIEINEERRKHCSCGNDHGIFAEETPLLCQDCYNEIIKNKWKK